jgi:glutathione S-transferase
MVLFLHALTPMKSATPGLTLYTFAMSHYSEKIRWTLDHSRIPYQEVCMTPVFHMVPALRMGKRGQTTLPILQTPDRAIQDSPRILDWLTENHGPLDALPQNGMKQIREVTQRFDTIGKDVARFLYTNSFGTADEHIKRLWTAHATPGQATVIRGAYPVIRWAFKRKLHINPKRSEIARERITQVIDWLEDQLRDGRTYLVQDHFSAADITAAALLAPIACPVEHPVYGDPQFAQSMDAAIAPWRGRPALQWVRQMYARHRGSLQGGAFSPQPQRLSA